jgi:N-acetylmuramoyl-L-alanine amidase
MDHQKIIVAHGYQRNLVKENPMDKIRLLIDPGHGGQDLGAFMSLSNYEKNINLNISQVLEAILLSHPEEYDVDMTRRTDVFLSLQSRVNKANKENRKLISIHCNAVSNSSIHGEEVFCFSHKEIRKGAIGDVHPVVTEGYALALAIVNSIHNDLGLKNRGAKAIYDNIKGEYVYKNLFVIRKTVNPAVLIECGFLTNADDVNGLDIDLDGFNERMALAIFRGINGYYYG